MLCKIYSDATINSWEKNKQSTVRAGVWTRRRTKRRSQPSLFVLRLILRRYNNNGNRKRRGDATINPWGRGDTNNISVWLGVWKRRRRRRRRNNQPSSPHPSRGTQDDPQSTPRSRRGRNNTTINPWVHCDTNNLHARARRRRRRRRRRRHPSPLPPLMLQSLQQKPPGRRTWRRRTKPRRRRTKTSRRRRRTGQRGTTGSLTSGGRRRWSRLLSYSSSTSQQTLSQIDK